MTSHAVLLFWARYVLRLEPSGGNLSQTLSIHDDEHAHSSTPTQPNKSGTGFVQGIRLRVGAASRLQQLRLERRRAHRAPRRPRDEHAPRVGRRLARPPRLTQHRPQLAHAVQKRRVLGAQPQLWALAPHASNPERAARGALRDGRLGQATRHVRRRRLADAAAARAALPRRALAVLHHRLTPPKSRVLRRVKNS
eukprot:6190541-Pleurochrysis_carterae.AAC.7